MMYTVKLKDEVIEFLMEQTVFVYPDDKHAFLVNNVMYYSTDDKNTYIIQFINQQKEYYDEY